MNIAAQTLSSEPHCDVISLMFIRPLRRLEVFSENQRRRELKRAFGSPRGFREAEPGEFFEEERETPLKMKRERGGN